MDDLMPIGEFSNLCGLSLKRLRSYAAGGLLVPAAVDAMSGYRYYAPGQLRDAQLIDALREAGMPLADIALVLRDPSTTQLDLWEERVKVDAVQRRAGIATARQLLEATNVNGPVKGQTMATRTTATRTDIGLVRDNNEDSIVVDHALVAVADGMGGAPGGEVASAIATTLVQASFTGSSADELAAGVRAANRAIWDRAHESTGLEGMGSTICALGFTSDGSVSVASIGDSRAYLFREGTLRRITEDHTIAAELVRRGELAETDAVSHPHRHVLTRVLGVGPSVDPDVVVHDICAGDRLLVCTDGLFSEVSDEEIAAALAASEDIEAIADVLIAQARANGAHDNVTVAITEVGG